MKQTKFLFLIIVFLSAVGAKVFAHDIEARNADGVIIYYKWVNSKTELAVTYQGKMSTSYLIRYSGSVVIPESVTYDGTTYPVTSIGDFAFYDSPSLTSVTIPNSITSIGEGAFQNCRGLTSVTIPNSITSIGVRAFNGCSGLTSVSIGNSVTSIGIHVFYNCHSLTDISVDENNTTYSSLDGVLFNKSQTKLIKYPIGKQGEYTIPNSVTTIDSSAFANCSNLASITIPNSVTTIDDSAFANCSNLASITIPNSVISIGGYAFANCVKLTSIIIPNSVTTIDGGAFSGCYRVTSVSIGSSATDVKWDAFSECNNINSVTINSNAIMSKRSYSSISFLYHAFGKQVTEYIIGDNVTSIGRYAFTGYSHLNTLIFSKNVTKIDEYAFGTYIKIDSLVCRATTPPICEQNALVAVYKWHGKLIVPHGSLAAYQSADEWKDFNIIEENDVTATSHINNDGAEAWVTDIYNTNGSKLKRLQRGTNIIKMSNGTSKKILVK